MAEAVKLICMTCAQANRVPVERLSDRPKCGSCGDALVTGKVFELDPASHDKATRGDDLALIVDYWAPWCGPCRMMAPEFAKAAAQIPTIARFAKINTQDHPQISTRLGIKGIPLLILYRGGREIARLAGARPAPEILSFIRQSLTAKTR